MYLAAIQAKVRGVDVLAARKQLRIKGFVRYPALLTIEELETYRQPVIEAADRITSRCMEW